MSPILNFTTAFTSACLAVMTVSVTAEEKISQPKSGAQDQQKPTDRTESTDAAPEPPAPEVRISEVQSISAYQTLPPEPSAIVVGSETYPVAGDGIADDTAPIQAALNAGGGRAVFLPSGKYRISGTLGIKKGTRFIGYGINRPELIVPPGTPAFQDAAAKSYVVEFLYQEGKQGNDTFYSAFDNINLRISDDNPGATGVFYDVAQGCLLKNVDMQLGAGNTGVHRVGSEIFNVKIRGGDYGITGGTVAWQLLVMDCLFAGQAKAAFGTSGAAPTLIRTIIRDTPLAFEVPSGNSKIERLYAKDCRFENISQALVLRDDSKHSAMKLNLENAVFIATPNLVQMREGQTISISPSPIYQVERFSYGLNLEVTPRSGINPSYGAQTVGLKTLPAAPPLPASDIPLLPPVAQWKNVRELGVAGDGATDDTAALQAAIDAHEVLFFPRGTYSVTKTLQLRTTSILIGLNPYTTLIKLPSSTKGFGNRAAPMPIVKSSAGGQDILSGIGIDAGINPGSVALLWRAGERSLVDDFWISWSGKGETGKSQYLGLWVQGGGGIVKNMWAANKLSQYSTMITDTRLAGTFYLVSLEHHLEGELLMKNASNWTFHALQTETHVRDVPDHKQTLPIRLNNCSNLKFTNLYIFQTTGSKRSLPRGLLGTKVSDLSFLGARIWSYNSIESRHIIEIPDRKITITQPQFNFLEF